MIYINTYGSFAFVEWCESPCHNSRENYQAFLYAAESTVEAVKRCGHKCNTPPKGQRSKFHPKVSSPMFFFAIGRLLK